MKKNYLKLDCSARFYPIMATKRYQSLFRFSAQLSEPVDSDMLVAAVNEAVKGYPMYKVRLVKGWAYHRLGPNDGEVPVSEYDGKLLTPIDFKKTNGYLFRLSAGEDKVALDFSHMLGDGSAALEFFKYILSLYFALKDGEEIRRADAPEEWYEDAFERYCERISLKKLDLKGMMGVPPKRIEGKLADGLGSIGMQAPASLIVKRAKEHGVSFTAYILGALAYSIEKVKGDKRPLVLMVPVNLRNIFPSESKRNFTMFTRVVLDPTKESSFADYVQEARAQLADGVDRDRLLQQISTTVKGMNNALMRAVPLVAKKFFARMGRLIMKSRQTIIFSNLSRVEKLPGISRMTLNLNVSKNNVQNLSALTYGDITELTFTSAIEERALPDALARTLIDDGIDVRMSTLL